MHKISLTLGSLLCAFVSIWANTDDYRIMWNGDPATSMVIGWNQVDGSNPIVYYDLVDHGTNVANYNFSNGVDRNVTAYGMENHFSRLTCLKPNTIYYFVIQDDNSTSQRFWFKTTPSDQTERLSFLAGGDSRNNRTQRQDANKLVASLRPHAVLFGGDYTASGTNNQWAAWFEDWQLTIGADGRMIPIVSTRGNHESNNAEVVDLFDVPSNDVYYKTVFGGDLVSAYTLNTEISIGGTQASWLASELANDNSVYQIAQYHKPIRSHVSNKAEGTNQYLHWVPLFDQHGMDLVIECDSHTSKSTWPIKACSSRAADEGFIRDDQNGVVYVGEGCWGAPLRAADDSKSWTRDSGMFNQIKWIFIDQNQIEVRTIKTDNADNVGVVNDNDIFTAPANLDINSPSNGGVIIIPNKLKVRSSSIASSFGDAEERQNGDIYENSTDIELINDGNNNGNQTIGLEFLNLNIPSGATIVSAKIQFTSDNMNNDVNPINLNIQADARPDPPSIVDAIYDISNRTLTANIVSWSPPTWTNTLTAGPKQLTPELKNVLQELVNQSGVNGLNSAIFVITGEGIRTAASYDQSPNYAAKLIISFKENCMDSDHDNICDSIDNCPSITNHDQLDANNNGIGDICENPPVSNCARGPIPADNINKWIGPTIGNWYDDKCNWSKGDFPTECDDVIIDLNNANITLRSGASAFGYTFHVPSDAQFHAEAGSSLCIEVY